MLHKKSKVKSELKFICRYQSLFIARIVLCVFLVIACIPYAPVPAYILAATLILPGIFAHLINSAHPERNQQFLSQATLTETIKECNFSYHKFRGETTSFYFLCVVLCIWQFCVLQQSRQPSIITILPLCLLGIYIITERVFYFYRFTKAHYNFTHINID